MHGTVPTVFYLVLLALIDASQIPRKTAGRYFACSYPPDILLFILHCLVKLSIARLAMPAYGKNEADGLRPKKISAPRLGADSALSGSV